MKVAFCSTNSTAFEIFFLELIKCKEAAIPLKKQSDIQSI